MSRKGDFITTFSGRKFWPLDPRPEEIFIEDVAHALSLQCRFAGHLKKHFSVAQHSLNVSLICAPTDALWGLLHDGTEAYLVDVPTPVKQYLSEYKAFERTLQDAFCERFGLSNAMPASVHRADREMLISEARDLYKPGAVPVWAVGGAPFKIDAGSPTWAEDAFLTRFDQLGGLR